MGNKASVSPSEGDNVRTDEGPRAHARNSLQAKQSNATPTVELDPQKRASDGDNVVKTRENAYKTQARTEHIIHEKVIDDRNDVSALNPSAHECNTPQAYGEFDGVYDNQQSKRARALVQEENINDWGVRLDDPIERGKIGDDAGKEPERYGSYETIASGSGTTSTGSYTSSTSNESRGSSFDTSTSDGTFFVPEEKRNDPEKNERASDCADAVRISAGGDCNHETVEPVELAPSQHPTGCTNKVPQSGEENETFRQKIGKTKRRRHYIKDDTMRTLFGLVPFYGGGEGPIDQMVKAALASVGPNTIDVRDEEGNTLLILACQHCCEDLVEPILAKGANPNAVNLVGSCALHYSCYADSLSVDTAEALLWRGADPATTEITYGCTPLHYAASAGDADICKLLLEHGAQPQIRDYYNCTAVKYAKDAGYDAIVEILEGERGGIEWDKSQGMHTTVVENRSGDIAPSGGLWIRYIDEETELGYVMNDETGESWWEIDLIAAAKDFLSGTSPAGPDAVRNKTAPDLPPLGVREWLVQGQVRSWLVTIFSRVDPLRLLEVDQIMQMGKADFKGMLEALLVHHGVKDVEFLRKSLPPKLESLGISSLIPTVDQPGVIDEKRTTEANQTQEVVVGLNVPSSQQSLNCADSCAALRAEVDKIIQGAILKQQEDLTEERNRQKTVVDKQQSTTTTLKDMMTKRKTATACAKQVAEQATLTVEKLQSTLVEDNAEQTSTDRLVEEIKMLKAGVAAERMRSSHIVEALEVSKGSAEERNTKQLELEEERRLRLEKHKLENDQEVAQLRAGYAKDLNGAKEAWKAERIDLERAMTEEIEQAKQLLKKTITGAANVLSDAAETTKSATDAVKQATIRAEEAKAWMMRGNEELRNSSKPTDQNNKQLHTNLRREMERAKQLHNQIEDTKGQTRTYARVRPMNSLEKEAGCKEVCLKDGKKQLAFLNAARQHWTYTNVFQISSAGSFTTAEEQAELYREVSGLGITLADGHSVFLMAAGAAGSGKTLTLIGDPEEAEASEGFFPALPPIDEGTGGAMGHMASGAYGEKKHSNKERGKRSSSLSVELPPRNSGGRGDLAVSITPLAGILPRLMAEIFATLSHRNVQSAFVVWVNAAYVSNMARPDDGEAVENLLSPPTFSEHLPNEHVEDERNGKRNLQPPPPAPPHDRLWGHAIQVSSAQEAMLILESARSRAASETPTESRRRKPGHFLSRVGVKVVNRSTSEESISEMVTVELPEERPGDSWPTALAELVRAHASTTGLAKEIEADGLLGMIRGCLQDTSKVVTFLCMSPADNQAEKTERTLNFGEVCESSEKHGASQLRDLKKELTRLKKESKVFKRMATSQLPRPAGGRQS